jgi:hypothetical protein
MIRFRESRPPRMREETKADIEKLEYELKKREETGRDM